MLGTTLAISLDALARREAQGETAKRARHLSAGFAQGRLPEKFTRQDVRLIESALRRMPAPPPVKVVAPNGDTGLLTREELRARSSSGSTICPNSRCSSKSSPRRS